MPRSLTKVGDSVGASALTLPRADVSVSISTSLFAFLFDTSADLNARTHTKREEDETVVSRSRIQFSLKGRKREGFAQMPKADVSQRKADHHKERYTHQRRRAHTIKRVATQPQPIRTHTQLNESRHNRDPHAHVHTCTAQSRTAGVHHAVVGVVFDVPADVDIGDLKFTKTLPVTAVESTKKKRKEVGG